MKTEYKYIKFEWCELVDYKRWDCINKKGGDTLGWVTYYRPWKQYVMEFSDNCVFNNSCLRDIAHFISQLNAKSKEESKTIEKKTPAASDS